jgi:hypothetical protein
MGMATFTEDESKIENEFRLLKLLFEKVKNDFLMNVMPNKVKNYILQGVTQNPIALSALFIFIFAFLASLQLF